MTPNSITSGANSTRTLGERKMQTAIGDEYGASRSRGVVGSRFSQGWRRIATIPAVVEGGADMTRHRDVTVVVVGGGFAGVACAKHLAKHDVPVTLIDRHDYNQFQPLLYQVATAQVETSDVARPLPRDVPEASPGARDDGRRHRRRSRRRRRSRVPTASRSRATTSCSPWAPSRTSSARPARPTHAFPLYSVDDAERLRSRLLTVLEAVAPRPAARSTRAR